MLKNRSVSSLLCSHSLTHSLMEKNVSILRDRCLGQGSYSYEDPKWTVSFVDPH